LSAEEDDGHRPILAPFFKNFIKTSSPSVSLVYDFTYLTIKTVVPAALLLCKLSVNRVDAIGIQQKGSKDACDKDVPKDYYSICIVFLTIASDRNPESANKIRKLRIPFHSTFKSDHGEAQRSSVGVHNLHQQNERGPLDLDRRSVVTAP
jgi:hypothetical protein